MRYTPVELRHVRAARGLFGYKRHEIDKLLEDVADSFEEVWSERGELADKVEDLEQVLTDVKQREALLTATLISAERAAADAREQANKEAELIIAEAHQEARSVTRGAQGERERLFGEARRVETLLRAALGMVEETKQELPASESSIEHWPNRQDTSEFQAVEPEAVAEVDEVPKLPPVSVPESEEEGPWAGRDFAWG
ncbi:MAG TPA: DivIVA domain-containing protein [Gaiellaceae bacterium]|jgi:cell division septum initiation protein DivIVA|nr:DivIVA domain-containing protein [Gaiellaceae bacterium]